MKKQKFALLLTSLLISSCSLTTDSSPVFSDESLDIIESDVEESSELYSESDFVSSESFESSESYTTSEDIEPTTQIYNERNVTHFLTSTNDVYRINITTEDNVFPYNKVDYINGSLNVTEQDVDNVLYKDMKMKIRLRGNSTLEAPKKPFKIKFDKKQSLFGLEKAKNWVLLANYYDKSNIRNYLAYLSANKLNNLGFQPSSIFVDVYFNNEYMGLYLLSEQVERNPGRVDIKNKMSKDGVSSFLIEADERAKYEYPNMAGKCYISSGNYDFALKDPDCDDYLEALEDINSEDEDTRKEAQETLSQYIKDITWLQPFLDSASNSIYTLNDYESHIDVASFVDYYLIEEFFKNADVGSTSQYYVIDQSKDVVKLAAGPVWDFDIGIGATTGDRSPIYLWYQNASFFVRERDYFYNALFKDANFFEKVRERYTELRESVFVAVFEEIDIAQECLQKAQQRNVTKWPLNTPRKTWIENNALGNEYYSLKTVEGHYNYLRRYLTQRLELFDSIFLKRN